MIRHSIAIRYIQECIMNCEKNQVTPNTIYLSFEQRAEILKHFKDIEIGSKGQYKIFNLDMVCTKEDIFSVGFCATPYNNWLKG